MNVARLLLRKLTHLLIAFTLIAGGILPVAAQTTGRIQGTVKDSSGGLVPEARITLMSVGTGVSRQATSDDSGRYSFLSVEAGEYQLAAERTGFKKFLRRGITLVLNQVAEIDIALEIGEVTESVTVQADASQVETTSTQLGTVVNQRAVEGLPLASRDTYQLLQLQAGVQSQLGADLFFGSDRAGVVSVNGGRGRANNYTVNGGDANDIFVNLPAVEPSPDSIQEFRVLTNTFDAEYGRNSGAIINVITKSGTNDLHGSLFEFFRNDALNARGFFDASKPAFKQNQFGFTLGGPITRNRSFFFVSYEGSRVRRGVSSDLVTVPTRDERAGDFSASEEFAGAVNDEFTADALSRRLFGAPGRIAAGTPYSELFPNNRIPARAFDPVALSLLNRFVPNGNVADGLLQTSPEGQVRGDQFSARIDHTLSDRQQMSVYYFFNDRTLTQPFARFQAGGATVPGFGTRTAERIQQLNISHTFTINPTAINESRFAWLRESQGEFNHPLFTDLVRNFGFNNSAGSDRTGITPALGADREGVPFIDLAGAFSIGNNFEGELPQTGNSYQWTDNFSKIRGKHTFKFGGDIRYNRFDQTLFFDINGQFFYFGEGTNSTGNVIADYLLGLPDSYFQGSAQLEAIRTRSFYVFGQDSYKIKQNLTLNYGLRWELNLPLEDKFDRIQTFRPGQATKVYPCRLDGRTQDLIDEFGSAGCNPGQAGAAVFPLGLVVPGDEGVPKGLTQTYYRSFAPRLGLAWSPGPRGGFLKKLFGEQGKTSIRAGWGMFYNPVEQLVLEQFSAEPPFGGSSGLNAPTFQRPFRLQDGSIAPNVFNGVLDPTPGEPVNWALFRPILLFGQLQPDLRSQYSIQYNLTIQREISRDLLFQIAYVGSQGHRLLATKELNPGNPQTCLDLQRLSEALDDSSLGCGPFSADSSYLVPRIPSGMRLTLPDGRVINGPHNREITLVGLRRYSSPLCDPLTGKDCPPDGVPVFSNIFSQNTIANSNYNSLQATVNKRWSGGLQLLGAYTWSKSIDNASSFENLLHPFNERLSRSLSLFDARHRFVLSYYWELPIGSIKGLRDLPAKLRDGWAVSGIVTFQSGFPIRITDGQSDQSLLTSFDFESIDQPDLVGPFRRLDVRKNDRLYFDPSAFDLAGLGKIGDAPRTICCGPGINNFDISVQKITTFDERHSLEFRAEFFNIFNHAQFLNPSGNIQDGDEFGRVVRVRDPRLIQFALKFAF
jgi:hypothetical protein